jgi:transcriptional regulator with AAA-type ATPase domain
MLGTSLIREMVVRDPVELDLGRTRIRVSIDRERTALATSNATRFGGLIGSSPAMRALYAVLDRVAPTSASVLITGESGTGKELAAHAIHAASQRAGKVFEVVDCGGLPSTLIESELFGHERGAFTGAVSDREGAFERADGGTHFLDALRELHDGVLRSGSRRGDVRFGHVRDQLQRWLSRLRNRVRRQHVHRELRDIVFTVPDWPACDGDV